jgi:hypothetical protein
VECKNWKKIQEGEGRSNQKGRLNPTGFENNLSKDISNKGIKLDGWQRGMLVMVLDGKYSQ